MIGIATPAWISGVRFVDAAPPRDQLDPARAVRSRKLVFGCPTAQLRGACDAATLPGRPAHPREALRNLPRRTREQESSGTGRLRDVAISVRHEAAGDAALRLAADHPQPRVRSNRQVSPAQLASQWCT